MLKRLGMLVGKLVGVSAVALLASPLVVLAEGAAAAAPMGDGHTKLGLALASGLGLAIAALGGALGQGRTAQAMLEGISRNPEASGKMLVPMIFCLAFIESLVLFTFVICFMLQGKI